MTGTAGSLQLRGHGFAVLPALVDLQSSGSGVWVNTGLTVALPAAGTYELDANVRASISAAGPGVNTWILARLFDVQAGAPIANSETIVTQLIIGAQAVNLGGNNTAPILIGYQVPGPRTIRLEAARHNTTGASTAASIQSNAAGRTTLRWRRVA